MNNKNSNEYEYIVYNRLEPWYHTYPNWITLISLFLFVLIWEIVCSTNLISSLFLPSPSKIILALVNMLLSGELLANINASLYRIILGFCLGGSLGLITGLLTGASVLADKLGTPLINAFYPIPKIALLPLLILWLGIGELSKIIIIALGVFFPIAMNTYSGVKNVDPLLIKVAITFNTNWKKIMYSVILPSALPIIFAGLRLAAGTALLLLIAAEMIAAQAGIGALILHYGDLMITDYLMAGVVVLSALGLLFNYLLNVLEKIIIPWKK